MKKIICLMLAVLMIASVSVVMAGAADNKATVTVYDIKGNAGDTVTYHVGDEFTAYLAVNASELNEGRIGSLQGDQFYTGGVLEVAEVYDDLGTITDKQTVFPLIYSGVVSNVKLENKIAFNASTPSLKGWQFNTDDSMLIVVRYKVVAPGNAEIKTTMRTFAESDYYLTRIIDKYNIVLDNFTTSATLSPAPAVEGSTVSGTVTSFTTTAKSNQHTVTVQLIQNGEVKYETSTVGKNRFEYSIEDVEAGDYTLRVSKKNHVTRDYAVTVDGDTVQDAKIYARGDANMDGKVNARDAARLRNHLVSNPKITDSYNLACADANGDNRLTSRDTLALRYHASGNTPLWVD